MKSRGWYKGKAWGLKGISLSPPPPYYLQVLLSEYSLCYCGHRQPALRPRSNEPLQKKGEEEEEETDADILQRDIIQVNPEILVARIFIW